MHAHAAALPSHRAVSARALIAAGLIACLLTMIAATPRVLAATTLNVGAGVGSGTVSGNAFLPGDVTILVGDSVKWTTESDEPHMVTFGTGPAGVPPHAWPVTGLTGTLPPPPGVGSLTGTYAGTGFLNTGLMFKGSSATVQFTAAGSLAYICAIHPGQAGTVTVIASGATMTQAQADAKATLTRDALLGAVAGIEAAQTAQVTETEQSDGTSLWNIFTNSSQAPAPLPGGGTGYLEVQRFVPPSLDIGAGDTVKWTALNTHTVTFPAAGQDPASIDAFTTPPTTNTTYDGDSLYHSGALAAGPGAPTTYQLTFPDAGAFPYICALHLFNGHTGQIVVAAAPVPPVITPPPTDVGLLPANGPASEPPWLAIGLLVLLATGAATGALVARRR